MKTDRALVVVALVAVAGVVLFLNRKSLGIVTAAEASSARQDAIRATIGALPRELTPAERKARQDAEVSLVENVGKYASQGSVGGYWGAAGGAVVGVFKEWFD